MQYVHTWPILDYYIYLKENPKIPNLTISFGIFNQNKWDLVEKLSNFQLWEEESRTVTEAAKQWCSLLEQQHSRYRWQNKQVKGKWIFYSKGLTYTQKDFINTMTEPKNLLRGITTQLHCTSARPWSRKRASSFSMAAPEEGAIYPIMILICPPLICRLGWQTRTDRNATWDEAD